MAPAATMDPSPISTPDRKVELAPIDAPFLKIGPSKS